MEIDTTPGRQLELADTLEFINTLEHSRDGDTDHLPSVEVAIEWLAERGALVQPVATAGPADLEQIRIARTALREVADAVVLERPADETAMAEVNRLLATRDVPELRAAPDGVTVASRHGPDPIADALAHLAEPLAATIAEGDVERLRICANDDCRWVFYDSSRTARRRWCDMTTCGNRAKAARHRARHRRAASQDEVMPQRS